MSKLTSLPSITERPKKRIGRGYGSGKGGHTVGRGTKGQGSRVGVTIPLWFEGGQLPLVKRLPMMRGKSRLKVLHPTAEVKLSELEKMSAETVTLETLKLEQVIDKRFSRAKVIGGGTLTRKITVVGLRATKSAKAAIEAAGGQLVD